MDQAVTKIGIVGAGAMGAGIAQVAATGGFRVVLLDQDAAASDRAVAAVSARIGRLAEKGVIDATAAAAACGRLSVARNLRDLAPCGLVIEAVVEDLAVKQRLFAGIEQTVEPATILASNTSSLSIGAIARACTRPGRVAGLHFFNPVPLMALVEVVPGAATEPEVIATLHRVARHMGRTPVEVRDSPGFLVNLGGRAYPTEALQILHEGVADPATIDSVMQAWGYRLGPFALMDLTGIDVNFPATRAIHAGFFADPRLRSTPRHRQMADSGLLGRKTGRGFHVYGADGQRIEDPAPATAAIAPACSVVLAQDDPGLRQLLDAAGCRVLTADDGVSPIVVAPLGEDASTTAHRLGCDPSRLVAIDMLGPVERHLTLMGPPGAGPQAEAVATALRASGRAVAVIRDSCGFIGQRISAMIANLGCEMAQIGLATPQDIDTAMTLGLNYPEGPLALCQRLGPARVLTILEAMQRQTGDDRYRPSLWLRRRAMLGLDIRTPG